MSHRRSLRFAKSNCPVCGSSEVARDDLKGDLLCTVCGHVITRGETRAVGKFEVAQILKREGALTFGRLRELTGSSEEQLYGVLQSMIGMGILEEQAGSYRLSRYGQRWYRQRLGQEWGY
ncbi:MAG: TFIIB-type zinc ribbon-containing protein [Candidatus Thorarchaeota archaeon]|nr:TFIIB-type zinc ribbon-containing protein [Candidatus Thorarchaeota archaeon]